VWTKLTSLLGTPVERTTAESCILIGDSCRPVECVRFRSGRAITGIYFCVAHKAADGLLQLRIDLIRDRHHIQQQQAEVHSFGGLRWEKLLTGLSAFFLLLVFVIAMPRANAQGCGQTMIDEGDVTGCELAYSPIFNVEPADSGISTQSESLLS
jgi:hypothetical protein